MSEEILIEGEGAALVGSLLEKANDIESAIQQTEQRLNVLRAQRRENVDLFEKALAVVCPDVDRKKSQFDLANYQDSGVVRVREIDND